MIHPFTIEPVTYEAFQNEEAQLEQCKEWGLLSEKASKTKSFIYKRNGVHWTCSIVGVVDKITAVIQFENSQLHCIHPSYLKEMQAANYGLKPSLAAEQPTGPDSAEPVTSQEGNGQAEADPVETIQAEDATNQAEDAVQEEEASPAEDEVFVQPTAEEGAKRKTKKEKAPQLQLPEHKVTMKATVKEFTTVPNNFSDNDDEVVVYEAVFILEPETEVGTAWSSYSATLKKLELEVGDTINFEGKIVTKKLPKHPVPYKLNNPAKIQKTKS